MITARLLNQDASLNDYNQIGGISYVNGDTINVVIQLYNEELGVRHIPSPGTTMMLGINFSDASLSSMSAGSTVNDQNLATMFELDAEDRSLWRVVLPTSTITDTNVPALASGVSKTLVGGNITFTMTGDARSPGTVNRGIIFNALQRIIVT